MFSFNFFLIPNSCKCNFCYFLAIKFITAITILYLVRKNFLKICRAIIFGIHNEADNCPLNFWMASRLLQLFVVYFFQNTTSNNQFIWNFSIFTVSFISVRDTMTIPTLSGALSASEAIVYRQPASLKNLHQ